MHAKVKDHIIGPSASVVELEAPPMPVVQHRAPVGDLNADRLIAHAIDKGVTVDQLERLLAARRELMAQQAKEAFQGALSRAQAKIRPIARNKDNANTKSKYADLAAINDVVVPIYSDEGLALSFNTKPSEVEKGWICIVGILMHEAGHREIYTLDLPPDDAGTKGTTNKTGVQAAGSTNEYGRRYLSRMIWNLSTYTDTDGNSSRGKDAGNGGGEGGHHQEVDDQLPVYPDEKFNKNLPGWKALIESKARTLAEITATVTTRYRFTDQQTRKLNAAAGVTA